MSLSKHPKEAQAKPAVPQVADLNAIMKSAAKRVGIPVLVIWVVAILIGHYVGLIIAGVLTLAAAGLFVWAWFYMNKSKRVANILRSADMTTAAGRQEAIKQLEDGAKKGDAATLFAKAQLVMHEDPRKALEVLEEINLDKTLPPVADEARGQRAMIHLLLGEVDRARNLADSIDLSRHDQIKSRAALAAIICEAWARSGQGKKASDTLDLFDPDNGELAEIKPQLYRARAFTAASQNDGKRMKVALRKLRAINPQLLGGFVQKKVHPMLEKEARQMLMESGAVPKKMMRQRA